MTQTDDQRQLPVTEDVPQIIQAELDETNRALKEITLMLEQSQLEVNKLSQRNAAITAHLQQMQAQAKSGPADELRMAYDSALDAQQRLFVMRGQLEKLQSDQSHLERIKGILDKVREGVIDVNPAKVEKGEYASVEMLVNAQEAERQRLSRQMHDGPAQALSNFILQTEIAMRLLDVDPGQAKNELSNLKVAAMSTFQKVRNFIFELRPMMLDDLGLVPTIRRYADSFREQTSVEVSVTVTGNERRLESYIEVMIFRSMQELLGNSVNLSQANMVKIQLDLSDKMIKLTLDDNGKGLDSDVLEGNTNLGMKLMKERVEMLGGTFDIDSAPGRGTKVTLLVPSDL